VGEETPTGGDHVPAAVALFCPASSDSDCRCNPRASTRSVRSRIVKPAWSHSDRNTSAAAAGGVLGTIVHANTSSGLTYSSGTAVAPLNLGRFTVRS
jgi:hypothetical protein